MNINSVDEYEQAHSTGWHRGSTQRTIEVKRMHLLREASKTRPFLPHSIRDTFIMVQDLFKGREKVKRVERKTQVRLAQRRMRKNGVGHAARDKQLAIILIGTAMEVCFGYGWEAKFTITVRNRQPLRGMR